MNILNIEHISKIYGEKVIFEDASFGVQEGDKVGIIGINGTGKSTLLKMLAGEEVPETGQIIMQNNVRLAYLPQNPQFPENATILSYIQDCEAEWKVQSNLTQLGITEYEKQIAVLSGGQRRKVALAKILAQDFDILLLDEPTNHLDVDAKEELKRALQAFKGSILMVCHEPEFYEGWTDVWDFNELV